MLNSSLVVMAGHRLPGWRTPWLSPAAPAWGEPCGVWLSGAQPLLLLAPKAVPQPQLLPFLSVPAPEPVACLCRTAPTVPESEGMGHIPCVQTQSITALPVLFSSSQPREKLGRRGPLLSNEPFCLKNGYKKDSGSLLARRREGTRGTSCTGRGFTLV